MTLHVAKFTPKVLLSAPRRSAGVPNPAGNKVLYTVVTYSFEEHRKTSQIRVLDIPSGEVTVLYEDAAYSEPVWVGDDDFFFLKSGGGQGTTTLLQGTVSLPGVPPASIATFEGGLANLQTLALADGALAIVLTGLASPDGKLYNPESDKTKKAKAAKHSSGRVYTSLFVRHWDAYVTKNRQAIWYGRVAVREAEKASDAAATTFSSVYTLVAGLTNLLAGTGLQSPVPPFGGAGDVAVGPHGIAFVARDPHHNEALTTISNLYFAPLTTYAEPSPQPYAVQTGGLRGYSGGPVFSPDGRSLVFTRMAEPQYESDQTNLLLVPDIGKLGVTDQGAGLDVLQFYASDADCDAASSWDARPDSIVWSADGTELFVTAEHHGRNALYRLPSCPKAAAAHGLPQIMIGGGKEVLCSDGRSDRGGSDRSDGSTGSTNSADGFRPLRGIGSVSDVQRLGAGSQLFVSMNSLIDSSLYCIVDPTASAAIGSGTAAPVALSVVSSQTQHGTRFGLSRQQLGELWVRSKDGMYDVHALVVRPSDFAAPQNRGRRWPLALLIHGGPQGAWGDSWSTRWNLAAFAEQGYVVVAPNPTGSTGYGMALENGIQNQWGGRPYDDLERCVDHVATTMPYVDMDRAVALGASYGGYMINWIQGHPLGRRMRALVCHDGVFSTLNQYASEELFFPLHDFGGTFWDNHASYARWDPAQHTHAWSTPMLVIHNELDYRLPITEGLAMFNVLQSRGVPSRLLSFPDENHWVLKPENSLVWHQEVLAWINKYTEGDSASTDLPVR